MPRHTAYLEEALRLQTLYAPQISLLIGFEGEWLRPAYKSLITELAAHPAIDYFVGSLHHVNGVPIDYDKEYYARAVASVRPLTNGSHTNGAPAGEAKVEPGSENREIEDVEAREEKAYERYYDQQYEMLVALRPRVVGHFDLIRLMSSDPGRDVRCWRGVWDRIERNLAFVASYGGWLECNSSALRKGLTEPYPCRVIAEVNLISQVLHPSICHLYLTCCPKSSLLPPCRRRFFPSPFSPPNTSTYDYNAPCESRADMDIVEMALPKRKIHPFR